MNEAAHHTLIWKQGGFTLANPMVPSHLGRQWRLSPEAKTRPGIQQGQPAKKFKGDANTAFTVCMASGSHLGCTSCDLTSFQRKEKK